MWADVAVVVAAYILGSVPHLHLLAKLRRIDLDGDYHQELWYRAGKITGVIGVLGEFAKGVIPVLVCRGLDFGIATTAVAGLAAVCGQMWPVFSKFDGEKGNSIGIAMAVTLIPQPALIALIAALIALAIRTVNRLMVRARSSGASPILGGSYSRILPIGMLGFFLILPFSAWSFGEARAVIWSMAALFVLIMLRRLTAGLTTDLKSGNGVTGIVLRRLFYDRAIVNWRQ